MNVSAHQLVRHRGRSPVSVTEKRSGRWLLHDGSVISDLSGGTLVETLSHLPVPDLALFNSVTPSYGFETPIQRQLDEQLLRFMAPMEPALAWSSSGTDAVERLLDAGIRRLTSMGIQLRGFLIQSGGYHGASWLTNALSSRSLERARPDGAPARILKVGASTRGLASGTLDQLLEEVDQINDLGPGWIALLEPYPTSGAFFPLNPTSYLPLLDLLQAKGVLTLIDEVASGSFRHGYFSMASLGAKPDGTALSKGLTQGRIPLAVAGLGPQLVPSRLAEFGGNTFGASPLASSIAITVLDIQEQIWSGNYRQERLDIMGEFSLFASAVDGARVQISPTTCRISAPIEIISRAMRSLEQAGIWAYSCNTWLDGNNIGFIHVCPPFDLALDDTASRLEEFRRALESVLGS